MIAGDGEEEPRNKDWGLENLYQIAHIGAIQARRKKEKYLL
jgi:hypothetical protein